MELLHSCLEDQDKSHPAAGLFFCKNKQSSGALSSCECLLSLKKKVKSYPGEDDLIECFIVNFWSIYHAKYTICLNLRRALECQDRKSVV